MNFAEALSNVQNLRKAIEQQEKDFESGKTDKRPSVNQKTLDLTEKMIRNIYGDYSKGSATIREALMSTDTVRLIPKVIEGQLREAAEPEYLASKFMNVIHVEGNNSAVYVVPVVGEIFASEVTEGGRYNEQNLDFNTVENGQLEIRVKKYGLKVTISEEAIQDSSWDIYGINVRKMGRAMARLKEENCFNAFSNHGHILFDNDKREQFPEAGTTGRDADGSYNDTLSVEDFLDLVLALMGNNRVPTDIIMHPLTWVIFARNSMIGNGLTFGAFGGNQVHPWGATQGTPGFAGLSSEEGPQKLIMRPDQVQNRLPVPLAINFSPFVRFDKLKKTF